MSDIMLKVLCGGAVIAELKNIEERHKIVELRLW